MKVKPPEMVPPLLGVESTAPIAGQASITARDKVKIQSAETFQRLLEKLKSFGQSDVIDEKRLEYMEKILQSGRLDDYLPQAVEGMLEESEWLEAWIEQK